MNRVTVRRRTPAPDEPVASITVEGPDLSSVLAIMAGLVAHLDAPALERFAQLPAEEQRRAVEKAIERRGVLSWSDDTKNAGGSSEPGGDR